MPTTARPTDTTPFQEELYAQLAPAWGDQDPQNGWALLKFIGAYAAMADQIETYARDTDDGKPGWSLLVDIERCPPEALPFLGQFVGVDVTNFARIVVLGANTDGDPDGSHGATLNWFGAGPAVSTPLPDGAVPIDTAAQSIVTNAMKVVPSGGSGLSGVAQILLCTPGLTYNLSMDAYAKALDTTQMVALDSATFAPVVGTSYNTVVPVADGWFNLNTTFVAPASGVVYLIAQSAGTHSPAGRYYTNFQFRQVRLETDGEYFERMRDTIRSTGGFYRGSPAAFRAAAQQFLTGSKTVILKERDPGPAPVLGGAYGLTVITYGTETPDQAKVLAALLKQKPAGIILDYEVINGTVYLVIRTVYATYTALRAAFLTYNGVRNNAPGT